MSNPQQKNQEMDETCNNIFDAMEDWSRSFGLHHQKELEREEEEEENGSN